MHAYHGVVLTPLLCMHLSRHVWHNARRYGFFKNKRIVLYDTLLEQCKEAEVVAVLAHELGAHHCVRPVRGMLQIRPFLGWEQGRSDCLANYD